MTAPKTVMIERISETRTKMRTHGQKNDSPMIKRERQTRHRVLEHVPPRQILAFHHDRMVCEESLSVSHRVIHFKRIDHCAVSNHTLVASRSETFALPCNTPVKKLLVAEGVVHVVAQRRGLIRVAKQPRDALILCVVARRSSPWSASAHARLSNALSPAAQHERSP